MLKQLLRAAAHIISPEVCPICGLTLTGDESLLCTDCLLQLPRTHLHLSPFNILHHRLGPGVPLDRAAAWYYYVKQSGSARLLVDTKYSSRPRQGQLLGELYAREIMSSGFFSGIDALVPVPMHISKRLIRGYNQTEEICRGISRATGIGIADILRAPVSHGVQARRSAAERIASVKDTFAATPDAARHDGRHLLVVDDIITTGATMHEAIATLHAACPASALSVIAIAATL